MTDNPFAPLLPWDESIAQAPEWRGGSSDTIVIGPDMTPDRFAVICQQVYDQGFRWPSLSATSSQMTASSCVSPSPSKSRRGA